MQQYKITTIMVMIFVGSGFIYADDVVVPGADLGKSATLPPPPGNVAPQPDPAANAQPQPQSVPAPTNRDALTRPVPGYQGGPVCQRR